MKSKYTKTIPALGLLLLSGAIAFPNLSDAMQLGINLDTQTKTDIETKYSDSNNKHDVNLKNEIKADIKAEKELFKEDKKNSTSTPRTENRPSIFGRIWSSIVHRDKEANTQNDELVLLKLQLEVDTQEAHIDWSTNVNASAVFTYSTSTDMSNATAVLIESDNKQSVSLNNLSADTTYYYKLTLDSENTNHAEVVKSGSFTTEKDASESNDDGPSLMWIRTSSITSDSAKIIWITPTRSTSKIWIESDTDVNTTVESQYMNTTLEFFHTIKVEDLEANTTYHFKVASTDKNGNTTISTLQSFTTRVE